MRRTLCSGCRRARCRTLAGFPAFCVAISATLLFVTFTPVYRPVSCGYVGVAVDNVKHLLAASMLDFQAFGAHVSTTTSISVSVEVQCTNENSYGVSVFNSKPGGIYLGRNRTQVGSSSAFPQLRIPAFGQGKARITSNVSVNHATFAELAPQLAAGESLAIMLDLASNVAPSLPSWLPDVRAHGVPKVCGTTIAAGSGLVENGSSAPLICGGSLDNVSSLLQEQESGSVAGRLSAPEAIRMSADDMAWVAWKKNIVLLPIMISAYLLGLVLTCACSRRKCQADTCSVASVRTSQSAGVDFDGVRAGDQCTGRKGVSVQDLV